MTPLKLKNPTPAEQGFADAFATLDGPDPARLDSWANFARAGLPHRRVEDWKYSDLRAAVREADAPLALDGIGFSPPPEGRYLLDEPATLPLPALAASMAGAADVYTVTGEAEPFWIEAGAPSGTALHRVIQIDIAPGAVARVQETYRAADGAFLNVSIRYRLGAGARLERVVRQEDAGDGVCVATAEIELAEYSRANQTVLAMGARLARVETHLDHKGEGAQAQLNGAYLLTGRRHADITSVVNHDFPNCATDQIVRGVVDQRASGAFQGRYVVARGADGTDARMHHGALLLDDGAQANSKPELLIYADDVQCAHGNTVGALDRDALFYMRSRGLPERQARALLIEAFVSEAFANVENGNTRDQLLIAARGWLGMDR